VRTAPSRSARGDDEIDPELARPAAPQVEAAEHLS
jgi:hypothetical protein